MGGNCFLEIAGYPVCEAVPAVHSLIMTIFQDSEENLRTRKVSERNPLVWGERMEANQNEEEVAFEYTTLAKHAIERLELMGFTIDAAREEYENGIARYIESIEEPAFYTVEQGALRNETEEWVRNYKDFTFDIWQQSMKQLITGRRLTRGPFQLQGAPSSYKRLLYTNEDPEVELFGFMYTDIRYFLRAALDVCHADDRIALDYTGLVEDGVFTKDDNLRSLAVAELSKPLPPSWHSEDLR
jgi:hypothetical protein